MFEIDGKDITIPIYSKGFANAYREYNEISQNLNLGNLGLVIMISAQISLGDTFNLLTEFLRHIIV